MATTIDSLDIQIRTSAGSSAANIDALSNALTRLKGAGSLTKVTNNLSKLSTALAGVQASSTGLSSLQSLATAMNSLAGIQKMTGLNSAINAVKKLPEITNALDNGTLTAFTTKIQQLSDALEPLATRINEVGRGFAKLPSQVSKTVTATNKMAEASKKAAAAQDDHSESFDVGNINMASFITVAQTVIDVMNRVGTAISNVISKAIEWDGIQFRFGRAFGEDAQQVYDWAQRLNETMHINVQEFMQYAGIYGSLLKGFGLEQQKVTAIATGLTELTYDIWAANNDRYKTFEEASEAVRSAITGEIEPIRNAGIALTEASMQEYLDSLGLAHVRMANLSEAQKAQVRYAVMVNSAMNQGIVGTYAQEMTTAEGAVRTLSMQMKSLGQAVGSIFIPLLSAAIPWVSAFVSILYEAVAAVAAFFSIPFFKIDWSGTSSGMGAVADNAAATEKSLGGAGGAAKKLRDYIMGFDELNVINPDTGGGGGGGGGAAAASDWEGLEASSLWDESILAKAQHQIDETKAKIKAWFDEWKTELAIIAGAMATIGLTGLLSHLGEAYNLGNKFLGVMSGIRKFATTALIITLGFAFMKSSFGDFMSEDGKIWDYIKGLLIGGATSWVLYSMWGPTGLVLGLGVTAIASLAAIIENGGINSAESATTALTGLASLGGAIAIAWKKVGPVIKASNLGAFLSLLKQGNGFIPTLAAAFPKTATALSSVTTAVTGALTGALNAVAAALGVSVGWAAAIVAAVVAAIVGAIWVATHWEEVTTFFTETVPEWFSGVAEKVTEWWTNFDIGETIRNAMGDAKEWFSGVRDDVLEFWDELVKDIDDIDWKKAGKNVGKAVAKAFKDADEWFSDTWKSIQESWDEFWTETLPDFFTETIPETVKKIQEDWNTFWRKKVPEFMAKMISFFLIELPKWKEDMKEIGLDIIAGIGQGIKDSWNEFWKGVGEFISGFVEGFKEELGISSPSTVFKEIGKFVIEGLEQGISTAWSSFSDGVQKKIDKLVGKFDDIKTGVSEAWNSAKDWYDNKKSGMKEYTPVIGSIQKKISDAWNAAKQWYEDKKAKLKEYTPDIGSIKDKLSAAWNTAKQWYENAKAKLATYTPDIGSIRDKLVSAWNTAKSWWTNAKGVLATYTPNIGSIRDKVISAWNSAKNWWSKSKGVFSTYTPNIGSIKDKLVSAWNTAKAWWNKNVRLSIPSLSFKVTYSTGGLNAIQKAITRALSLPGWPKLSFAAGGGIFDQGSLVWAGESGPEIVANASGGKTGVMNVDQMQSAVYEGVYTAVAAAMARTGGGGSSAPMEIKVYLDGKQITAAVEKNQKERGMAFMGTQVYAY